MSLTFMRIIYLFFFILSSFYGNAASPDLKLDSLPSWKQFRKLNKKQLLEQYKNDAAAIDIIKGSSKKEIGLLFGAGGFAVISMLLFILGDVITLTGGALADLFILILLGILFLTAGAIAITFLILYFTGKKRRLFNRLTSYFRSKE